MVVRSTNVKMNNINSTSTPHASRREKVFDLLDRCWGKKRSQYELQNYVRKQTGKKPSPKLIVKWKKARNIPLRQRF